jgi:hypothetical protein
MSVGRLIRSLRSLCQHISFKNICQQLFLVVPVRVELTRRAYETQVGTVRVTMKKPSEDFSWRAFLK